MASFVLTTMATSSDCSAGGTWKREQGVVQVVHERGPLVLGDAEVSVGVTHRPSGVLLLAADEETR